MPLEAQNTEVVALRQLIHAFIAERKQLKLDKLKPDQIDERARLDQDYAPSAWLADAVRRSSQIQLATHTLKPIHPDARGTSLYAPKLPDQTDGLVGSHCLSTPDDDVVGNAAALDVFKLLKLSLADKTVLQRLLDGDPALPLALSDNPEEARAWVETLAAITEGKSGPTSHTLAKQVYFPLDAGGYHLLAPLFPSSLVHKAQRRMRDDRYGEAGKAAREAWRERGPSAVGFREYPDLLVQNFGGTKPQNISQLNSERYGENWLLPSLPPVWRTPDVRLPLGVRTVFDRWLLGRRELWRLTRELREFLAELRPDQNNITIRNARAEWVSQIVDEVLVMASELQDLPEGWSLAADCRLDIHETCWLDPGRAESDEAFLRSYQQKSWQDEVANRFANWFNRSIETETTPMSAAEHHEWQGILLREFKLFRDAL